jgi:hypothetical protein
MRRQENHNRVIQPRTGLRRPALPQLNHYPGRDFFRGKELADSSRVVSVIPTYPGPATAGIQQVAREIGVARKYLIVTGPCCFVTSPIPSAGAAL